MLQISFYSYKQSLTIFFFDVIQPTIHLQTGFSFLLQKYRLIQVPSFIIVLNFLSEKSNKQEVMYVTKQIQNKFQKQKNYFHQRSIFREMMLTCDKLGNSFLTKQQSKKFQFMQTMQKQDQMLQSSHKKKRNQRWSHQPKSYYCRKDEEQVFVKQSKQIKQIKDLRAKMLPKVSKSNFQRKMKQIIYIKNMGQKKRKNQNISTFIKKTQEKNQQNILKEAWDNLQKTRLDSTTISEFRKSKYLFGKSKLLSAFTSQKQTPFKLSKQSSKLDVSDYVNECTRTTTHNLTIQDNINSNDDNDTDMLRNKKINTNSSSRQLQKFILSNGNIQNTISSQKSSFYRPPPKILDKLGIQKDLIIKQNAHKLYNLIKGGYCLDPYEVQGQFISMKGFKQRKQNFMMLKECYKAAKQHRYLSKNLQNELKGQTFKALVFLCQLNGKIAPSQLNNFMKLNKVVQ